MLNKDLINSQDIIVGWVLEVFKVFGEKSVQSQSICCGIFLSIEFTLILNLSDLSLQEVKQLFTWLIIPDKFRIMQLFGWEKSHEIIVTLASKVMVS